MTSKAKTVKEYLEQLPQDRRDAIEAVRAVILKNLGKGYEEGMQYGMIAYYVPHSLYPAGYHCDPKLPLTFTGLASQKNYMAVYLYVYMDKAADKWFRGEWAKSGKKLDMGKCCVRFKKIEDAALDVIGKTIKRMPLKDFIQMYETVMKDNRKNKGKRRKDVC